MRWVVVSLVVLSFSGIWFDVHGPEWTFWGTMVFTVIQALNLVSEWEKRQK